MSLHDGFLLSLDVVVDDFAAALSQMSVLMSVLVCLPHHIYGRFGIPRAARERQYNTGLLGQRLEAHATAQHLPDAWRIVSKLGSRESSLFTLADYVGPADPDPLNQSKQIRAVPAVLACCKTQIEIAQN